VNILQSKFYALL